MEASIDHHFSMTPHSQDWLKTIHPDIWIAFELHVLTWANTKGKRANDPWPVGELVVLSVALILNQMLSEGHSTSTPCEHKCIMQSSSRARRGPLFSPFSSADAVCQSSVQSPQLSDISRQGNLTHCLSTLTFTMSCINPSVRCQTTGLSIVPTAVGQPCVNREQERGKEMERI